MQGNAKNRPSQLCRPKQPVTTDHTRGNAVTQLRRQGIETEISRYNDRVKQSNTKGIEQEQARNTDVLDTGLTRANNRLEQWQKNQEAKRQEKNVWNS